MEQKIRIGAVSYLNTKPLIYGLQENPISQQIDLILDYPSNLTTLLQKDKIDIALLPVATIPLVNNAKIISKFCIAANKKVNSVCLFSEVPIEDIQEIYLDYQSRTSVMLLRLLLKDYWKLRPALLQAEENYIANISGKKAGLIIGDRALENLGKYPYIYDLAEAWFHFTKLPFVFAAWVSNKEIDVTFIELFEKANELGINRIKDIAKEINYPHFNLKDYYENNIHYTLDEEKRNGLTMFLKMIENFN